MMASVRIRPATPDDAEAITRIYIESAAHHALIDPERNHIPDRVAIEERYRTGRQHPDDGEETVTLLAETGGEIAGFLDARLMQPFDPMYRPATVCFIADIAVSTAHRSRGIGEQLMQAAEEWARRHGAEFVTLEYHSGNPRAGSFYARLGYRNASVVAIKRL
jgi:ribosomal protein S18 acetylase RimI-like enzyme